MVGRWSAACALAVLAAAPARAAPDTLYDAALLAYASNPTLAAQRAELRATDEGVVQARAGFGPTVSVTGGGTYQAARLDQPSVFGGSRSTELSALTGNGDLSIVQPLYTGGQATAAVGAASADVLAAREVLRQAETQVLTAVATAFLDVRRDARIVAIVDAEIAVLSAHLGELRAKGSLGALSQTDVAQGEARVLAAKARRLSAQARLAVSRAAYLAAVGRPAGELAPEPDLPSLPAAVDSAFDRAAARNPQLMEAVRREEGARARTAQARALNHATVSLRIDAGASPLAPYDRSDYDQNVTAAVVFSKPIFTSGLGSSRVREALAREERERERVEAARRAAVQAVSQAWDQFTATEQALGVERAQVQALARAAEGQRVESRAGLRSVIDLLNAEQELESAQITLVEDEHDAYLAHVALLAATGDLEVGALAPDAARYDATAYLKRERGKFAAPWEGAIALMDRVGALHTGAPDLTTASGERRAEATAASTTGPRAP